MSCPNCAKLPLAPTYFCCQECFKEAWPTHKKIHKLGKQIKAAQEAAEAEKRKGQEVPEELRRTMPDWAVRYR